MATQRLPDLPPDDVIRAQPVSEQRVRRLLDNYLGERKLTRTTEMLFDRVEALRRRHPPAPEEVGDFGFRAVVFKRSFLEGINSIIVSAQGWAEGQEDFLLKYVGENLRQAANGSGGSDVAGDATSILSAFDEMAAEMRGQGFSPSAFVVAGSIGQSLYEELRRATLNSWQWYLDHGADPGKATYRLIGVHADVPVVFIEAVSAPTLYVVDLARFATLTRYGTGPDFEPEFVVKEFDDDEARDVLRRQPRLILDPPPEGGSEIERIRQLQLRVGLELWETYKLEVKDPEAVVARPLADPTFE